MSSSLQATGEGLVWLLRAVVCLLAATMGSSCSLTQTMDGRIVRCGIISSCQSATTSEIVKRFWSPVLTHVRGAIASTWPLPLPATNYNSPFCVCGWLGAKTSRLVDSNMTRTAESKLSLCNWPYIPQCESCPSLHLSVMHGLLTTWKTKCVEKPKLA